MTMSTIFWSLKKKKNLTTNEFYLKSEEVREGGGDNKPNNKSKIKKKNHLDFKNDLK